MKDERINNTRIKCYALPEDKPDRFTVVYPNEVYNDDKTLKPCVGLSGHGAARFGKHLGKRIPFSELPDSLKRVVEMDTAVTECEEKSLAEN